MDEIFISSVNIKFETASTEYQFDRIMVLPNNLFIPDFREDSHIRSNSNLYLTTI